MPHPAYVPLSRQHRLPGPRRRVEATDTGDQPPEPLRRLFGPRATPGFTRPGAGVRRAGRRARGRPTGAGRRGAGGGGEPGASASEPTRSSTSGQLPHHFIWRMLGHGSYVIEVEPCTNRPAGRLRRPRPRRADRAGPRREPPLPRCELGALVGSAEIDAVRRARVREAGGLRWICGLDGQALRPGRGEQGARPGDRGGARRRGPARAPRVARPAAAAAEPGRARSALRGPPGRWRASTQPLAHGVGAWRGRAPVVLRVNTGGLLPGWRGTARQLAVGNGAVPLLMNSIRPTGVLCFQLSRGASNLSATLARPPTAGLIRRR